MKRGHQVGNSWTMKRLTPSAVFLSFALLGFGVSGCGPSAYQATMNDVQAAPPSVMVATKVPTTLYIVLDPATIEDVYAPKSERRGWTLTITDFRTFVSRDLKKAMSPYFQSVEVVAPGATFPDGPHVVADVKVDSVKVVDQAVTGQVTIVASYLTMTWGYAIRTSDSSDYLFSFAGVSSSSHTSNGVEDFVAQMVDDAITGLLSKWSEADVTPKLRAWAEGGTMVGTENEGDDAEAVE